MARHPADERGDHRGGREGLDPVLSRPAAAHEPLEQRRPLGAAHAPVPAHHRVPVAGGAHVPRHRGRGRRGGRDRSRGLPRRRRGLAGHPGHPRAQEPRRDVPGCGLHPRHRGDDARPQGAPGGHQPHARQELRAGRGHRVPRPRQPAQATPGARRGASRRAWSGPRSWPTATTAGSSCRPTSRPSRSSSCPSSEARRTGSPSPARSSRSSGRWPTSRRARARCA